MFRSKWTLIGVLCVISLVSFVLIESVPVQTAGFTDPRSPSSLSKIQQRVDLPESRTGPLSEEYHSIEDNVVQAELQSDAADEQSEILQTLQALVTADASRLQTGPGWLHVELHHRRSQDAKSELANGQELPLDYIADTWYHLNEAGLAVEVVKFVRNEEGIPTQIATFKNNTWRNLTVAEEWRGDPFVVRLDLGFSADANQVDEWGATLHQQSTMLADQPAIQFVLRENFDNPLHIEGYAKPIIAAERRAVFTAESGTLKQFERIFVDEDGQYRTVEQVNVIASEYNVEPPAEVLALLEKESVQ